jgi:ubiquinone/menaquinone biosynthesis C-methylase UbiE
MVLSRTDTQKFYDRFGKKQDSQAFYEDAGLDELVNHGEFDKAQRVFEFGCGTGRFAARLLKDYLPSSATYLGIDLSQTMVDLATQRLSSYTDRARVMKSDGSIHFPLPDHAVDRVVCTYVIDLLPDEDFQQFLSEAQRVLVPGGKLCLMSLTCGTTFVSRIVSSIWSWLFRLNAYMVGGCRPIRLQPGFDEQAWAIDYHHVVVQFGVPTEVLVASAISIRDQA